MQSRSTPRVNFELLERHLNQRVLLVGLIDQAEGGRARLKASDGGTVTVELRDGQAAFDTPYVEFRGVVTSQSTLKEESRTYLGSSFELATYNRLCKLASSDFRALFA